ncbi:Stk1 family PASTA domain-containing Ser/Thr kinase, partial [Saccharomonospora iraqiensis]|uniref:Stk1 family PASTA domain-containing Ser/Thr kinase n=1 Tax=Saccharomonospora iraqiensis TaxID=52698 RepID=UPI00022E1CC3
TTDTGVGEPHREPPEDGPARPGGLRRVPLLVWALVGLLLAGGVGAGLWWVNDGRYITVPSVAGTERDRAEDTLRTAGLQPEMVRERHNTTPNGTVIRTEPAEGARVTEGDAVTVVVSMGRPVVPDVRPGASVEQAQQAISEEQLEPRRDPEADRYSDQVPEGAVVALEPAPGSQANVGDAVTIVVSQGPPPTPVPDVSGQGRDQAFQALRNAGFEPYEAGAEFSESVPAGRVVRTEPAAGGTMEDGNRVGVVLSNAVEVPSVVGRRAQHAVRILGEAGLGVEGGNGRGPISFVVGQSPDGGSLVRPGTTISLTVVP